MIRKAKKHEEMLKGIKKEVRSKRPIRISAERPPDSLTHEHIRLIKDEIQRVENASNGKNSNGKICSPLKKQIRKG